MNTQSDFDIYDATGRDVSDKVREAIKALPVATAKEMAYATYRTLVKMADDMGQTGKREVFIKKPGECGYFANPDCYVVSWEAGPYEWGITASLADVFPKLVEPYYSFDLCFYPAEDKRG